MSLRSWLSRPLSWLSRWSWIERFWRLEEVKRPRNTFKPKPNVRLELELCERREVPLDLWGVLQSSFLMGGLPLLGGFDTPATAFFRASKPMPTGPAIGSNTTTSQNPTQPQRSTTSDPSALQTNTRQPQQDARTQQPQRQPDQPTRATQDDDFFGAVSSALAQMRASLGAANSDDAPKNGGGGGDAAGGGSGGGSGGTVDLGGGSSFSTANADFARMQTGGFTLTQPSMAGAAIPPATDGGVLPAGGFAAPQQAGGTAGAGSPSAKGGGQSEAQGGQAEAQGGGQAEAQGGEERLVSPALQANFGRSRLPFELNQGQAEEGVTFVSRGPGFSFALKGEELLFSIPRPSQGDEQPGGRDEFTMRLVGMNASAEVVGREELPSRSNYFVGDDPSDWHTNVPNYGRVEVRQAFAGVDLILRSRTPEDRVFEHDFVVKPGAEVSAIRVRWEGVDSLSTDEQGRLLLHKGQRTVIQDAPVLYQESFGVRTTVQGRYVLHDDNEVGFEVTSEYDRGRALTIDPALSFSSYLGGSGDDYGYAIAADAAGNSYVTGASPRGGSMDAFVTKLNAAGNAIAYTTYVGDAAYDFGAAIAVDLSGNAYVVGSTKSSGFPTTAGVLDDTYTSSVMTSDANAFVLKLNPTGDALLYSTFLGAETTLGLGVAVDADGSAYVAGVLSADSAAGFPVTGGAFQSAYGGGNSDAFVSKLSPDATTLTYSSFLGGDGYEGTGWWAGYGTEEQSLLGDVALALDDDGNAYVVGHTDSDDFPTTGGAYDSSVSGQDAYAVKVNAAGSSLLYGTYLGGSGTDVARAVAVGPGGRAFVTGSTGSFDFPTAGGAVQTSTTGWDAFVTALEADGGGLLYSTYLGGGTGVEVGYGIAVDAASRATVVGSTTSLDFPTYQAWQGSNGGGFLGGLDGFVTKLTPTGTLIYSSYHGGSSADEARGVALDARGDASVAGSTDSTDLPGAPSSGTFANQGGTDAFVARILPRPSAPTLTTITDDTGYSASDEITNDQALTFSGRSDAGVTVTLERAGVGVLGSTTADGSGVWTYTYASSLGEGSYAFTARATDANGNKSDYSAPEFLVDVDLTAPTLTVSVPSTTPSLGPDVLVTARDTFGIASGTTVTLDVDLNNNASFADGGEANYATGYLSDGHVFIKLPTLTTLTTYRVQARVTDLAGNQGTSAASTFTVTAVASPWVATAQVLSVDPSAGTFGQVLGDVSVAHALDLDQSPGSYQGGDPALVYHSTNVSQAPFVQVSVPSDNSGALPTTITLRLSVNGTAANTVTYNTSGFAPGDVFTASLQAPGAITSTGRFTYSVLVQIPGEADQNLTGSSFVVALDSSPFGAGWSFLPVYQLHTIAATLSYAAGMLLARPEGGWLFYEGTSTYSSPQGDPGTLTVATGGGVSTYTYTAPDNRKWTFDDDGLQVGWSSGDGSELLTFAYDGSRLSTITAVDGGVSTIAYNGGSDVVFRTVNNRVTTLTLSSGDLTSITNPDGGVHTFVYDGSHRLIQEQFGPNLENNWAYTSAGVLGTMTWGATQVNSVANLSRTTPTPLVSVGQSGLTSGTPYAYVPDANGHTERYAFDSRGRVTERIDAEGARYQYGYTNGFLSSVTDPELRTTTFANDAKGYVTKTTLADGSVMTYLYAANAYHSLTASVDARGNTMTYAFDGNGRMTTASDREGNVTSYAYSSGLLTRVTDPRGNATDLLYDAYRRHTGTIDASTNRSTITFDANGNVETVSDELGRVTTYANDVMGRTTVVTDSQGNLYSSVYDVTGMLLSSTDPMSAQSSTEYDTFKRGLVSENRQVGTGLSLSTVPSYDDSGRQTKSRDATGFESSSSYSPAGQASSTTDALGGKTRSVFDLLGRAETSFDAVGRWAGTVAYDSVDRTTSRTDALGQTTQTLYDKNGNVTVSIDELGRRTTTLFDKNDRATVTIDALLRRSTTVYDADGNVSTVTDHKGNVTSYAYDALNRQTKVTMAVGSSVQVSTETTYDEVGNVKTSKDGLNNVVTFNYDSLNRQTEVIDALTHRTTTLYNTSGDVTESIDALGKRTTFVLDGLHRRIATKDPLSHLTTTILDANGSAVGSVDGVGNLSQSVLDAAGRQKGSLDALGGFTANAHDGSGGMRTLTDPVGNEWRYVHDALGRESVSFDPAGEATTTTYDGAGRVSTVTDRLGRQMVYGYDDGDRTTSVVWKSAGGATVNLLTYTYDDNDNLLTARDNAGTVTYAYDERDRVKTYTNVFGQLLTYAYDAESRVTQRDDSLGGTLTSVYDAQGRLTSRKFAGTGATGTVVRVDFGYSDRDEQSSVKWFSDLSATTTIAHSAYSRDDAGRLTSIVNKDGANATLSYYNYSHDDADRVTNHSYSSAIGTVVYSGTKTYVYDATSQLTNDGSAYSYDANGNRTMAGYQTGVANRMSNDGTFTYTYDDAGNVVNKSKGAGLESVTFTYDHRNRLTNVRNTSDGSTNVFLLTYTYDVEDNRVQEDRWKNGEGNSTTRFVYDWAGGNVVIDTDGSNTLLARRIYGDATDQNLVRTQASGTAAGTSVFFTDHLGSVRDVANASGVVKGHVQYDGFGVRTDAGLAWLDRYGYTGRECQVDTGLNYHRERWYDPPRGVWMNEDPAGLSAGDSNLSRYVTNNPVNLVDPFGLWEIKRDGKSKAVAKAEKGDTIAGLGTIIGLESSGTEWHMWLTASKEQRLAFQSNDSAKAKVQEGDEFYIPNTLVFVWAGDLTNAGGKLLMDWEGQQKYAKKLGFKVVTFDTKYNNHTSYNTRDDLIKRSKKSELHGLVVVSHGNPEGFGAGGWFSTTTEDDPEWWINYAELAPPHKLKYGLGVVIINACHSGFSKNDKVILGDKNKRIKAGGRDLVSEEESAVSGLTKDVLNPLKCVYRPFAKSEIMYLSDKLKPGKQGTNK